MILTLPYLPGPCAGTPCNARTPHGQSNRLQALSWRRVAVCNSFSARLLSTSGCASSQGRALEECHTGHLVMPAARPTHTRLLSTPFKPRPPPPPHQHFGYDWHTPDCGPCQGIEQGRKCFLTDCCSSTRSQHAWWLLCGHFVHPPPLTGPSLRPHTGPQRVHTTPASLSAMLPLNPCSRPPGPRTLPLATQETGLL